MIKFAPVVLQDGGSEAGMNFAWDEYNMRLMAGDLDPNLCISSVMRAFKL